MSQYLSNFYCGNKRGLCNYNQPVDYGTLLNRNFDPTLHKMLEDCQGAEFEKGYCCDPNNVELQKPMDDEYMEHINRKFEAKVFEKDEHGNFWPGQVPLIKPLTQNGKLKAMEVCSCGGTPEEFAKCVSENCEDYRYPTRYEYCKLGSDLNQTQCVLRPPNTEGPAPSESDEGKTVQERCKLGPTLEDTQYLYSHNFKVNNLFPDCYLNLCNKNPKLQILDKLINSSTTDENKYFKVVGDSLPEYDYLQTQAELNKEYKDSLVEDQSLLSMFKP